LGVGLACRRRGNFRRSPGNVGAGAVGMHQFTRMLPFATGLLWDIAQRQST